MYMLRYESSRINGCLFYLLVEMFALIIQFLELFTISIIAHRINFPLNPPYFPLPHEN